MLKMIRQFTFDKPKEIFQPAFWLFVSQACSMIPAVLAYMAIYTLGQAFIPPYTLNLPLLTKLAAVLVSGGLRDFKKMMDAGEVGGTPLIGISKPVIKAHGSSDAFAIKNAIRQAQSFAASGIIEDITENIDHMRLRSE